MIKIAIIQFPGTNCEYETRRMVKLAGMDGVFFRWNENHEELKNFDGFIVPGGFSYEDRVRSGVIASKDPIMNVIKEEALKGKPVLGICNGAQILVESGLIPGLEGFNLASALAVNKRIKNDKVLGTGFYNTWCNIKNDSEANRTAFTYDVAKGHYFKLPIAHGEGRFTMEAELLEQLKNNGQTLFRYCDDSGEIIDEFPTNPNGSTYNLAGVSNPKGNVLALMPHPERTKNGLIIFESIKKYIEANNLSGDYKLNYQPKKIEVKPYERKSNVLELFVDLIITDNEAVTARNALRRMGFEDLKLRKQAHWEIECENIENPEELAANIILSNELLNTSKETASLRFNNEFKKFNNPDFSPIEKEKIFESDNCFLVRYKEDFVGQSKLDCLKNQFNLSQIKGVKKGIIWQIKDDENNIEKIINTNIFFNPYSQDILKIIL